MIIGYYFKARIPEGITLYGFKDPLASSYSPTHNMRRENQA